MTGVMDMKMLDIDLDFFQTGIHCFGKDCDNFLTDENITVWKEKDIIDFLEQRCGLSKRNKIKGRILKHHVEAYSYWNELINKGEIMVPFEVTHIDAHSDLAYSSSVPFYKFIKDLDNEELQAQLKDGMIFKGREQLINSGNYLLAAIIVGWVDKVKYVFHPALDYLDVFDYIVENIEPNKLFRFNFCNYIKKKDVYLEMISSQSFVKEHDVKYDYATIALSPAFVKKEMNEKLDVIREYIEIN